MINGRKKSSHNRKNLRPKLYEVWLADMPFENSKGGKQRPVIVVKEGENYGVVILTTSPATSTKDFSLMIPEEAGMDFSSTVKAGTIHHITASKFIHRMGKLSDYDREELLSRL